MSFVARARGLCALALMVGVGLPVLAKPARADLCNDTFTQAPPRLSEKDPLFRVVISIWRRVYEPFLRATGRVTELVVLAPEARTERGAPFPALAMACQRRGRTPAVVVTSSFLAVASVNGTLDEPFVALILGHELGHRLHDFDAAHLLKAGVDEGRADRRGAFLAAAAGYDARRVVCEDRIDSYLDAEGVDDVNRMQRRSALPAALQRFEMWENLYALASGLVFSQPTTASALLTASRAELARVGESLPEMQLLEALALMHEAAGAGCWTEAVFTPGFPNSHLRCIPVFASHTSLAPRATDGHSSAPTRGCDEGALRKLEKAASLLDEIDSSVVSGLGVATARTCLAFYLGDPDEAAKRATEAEALVTSETLAEIRQAVAANRALVSWLKWWSSNENKPPPTDAPTAVLAAWRRKLAASRRAFAGHPELDAWLDFVSGKARKLKLSGLSAKPPRCFPWNGAASESAWGDRILPPMPTPPPGGGCPCDWVERSTFVDPLATTPRDGAVRVCAPAGDGGTGALRYIELHLPMRGVDAVGHIYRPMAGTLAQIATWQRACDSLEMVGVTDSGLLLWQGSCAALGGQEVLIGSDGCQVRTVIRHTARVIP